MRRTLFFFLCGIISISGIAANVCTKDGTLEAARMAARDLLENRTCEGEIPGCYSAEVREAFRRSITEATTQDQLNAAINIYEQAVNSVMVSDGENEYWYYIVSGPSKPYCQNGAIYDMSNTSGEQLKWNDRTADRRCMWKFEKTSTNSSIYRIVNKATGYAIKNPGTQGAKVTTVENLYSATGLSLQSLGEQRAFLIRSNGQVPIHADQIGVIVAWNTTNIGSASVWHFDPVPAEDLNTSAEEDTYEMVWHDEFDQDGPLNENDWNYEHGFVRNQEPQWYQSDNAICRDGNLVITAQRERVVNTNYENGSTDWRKNREYAEYTSSSVTTEGKHDLTYGRIEVRAKIPTSSGAWPAIWTLGHTDISGAWPACGEIDILEFYSKSIHANVAWSDAIGNSRWRSVKTPFTHFTQYDPDWSNKYHIWRMDWDSTSIRLYLDNELLNVTSLERTNQPIGDFCRVENPFHQPQYLLLNLALRPSDGMNEAVFPLTYYIDYVRFYKKRTDTTNGLTHPHKYVSQRWCVMYDKAWYVDMRNFTETPTVTLTDLNGKTIFSHKIITSDNMYRIPQQQSGIYILTADDGICHLNQKIVI